MPTGIGHANTAMSKNRLWTLLPYVNNAQAQGPTQKTKPKPERAGDLSYKTPSPLERTQGLGRR